MLNCDLDGVAARSEQKLSHFRIGLALHRVSVDRENAIAEAQAGASCWRIREGGANVCIDVVAFAKIFDGRSDSEVFRALLSAEGSVFSRIEVSRVRIQDAQHAADRRLEDRVVVQFVDRRCGLTGLLRELRQGRS